MMVVYMVGINDVGGYMLVGCGIYVGSINDVVYMLVGWMINDVVYMLVGWMINDVVYMLVGWMINDVVYMLVGWMINDVVYHVGWLDDQ